MPTMIVGLLFCLGAAYLCGIVLCYCAGLRHTLTRAIQEAQDGQEVSVGEVMDRILIHLPICALIWPFLLPDDAWPIRLFRKPSGP